MQRNTQAIINLDHIRANYGLANEWAPESKNIAVIKADAYGHGLVRVAKHLESEVPAFAVAIFNEAKTLREAGIRKSILLLQGIENKTELIYASENDLWIMLQNENQLNLILSTPLKNKINIWLKLDTGLHRLGLDQIQFNRAVKAISSCQWVKKTLVIASHFSCAGELDNNESLIQLNHFNQMIEEAEVEQITELSIANSPAIAQLTEANLDWNRPGLLLYGLPLFNVAHKSDNQLKAAMTFQSEIIGIREIPKGDFVGYGKTWQAQRKSKIATVAAGYADGYPRQAKNGTPVLVNGEKTELSGSVSMDLLSIDVTDISKVGIGDKVELWGENLCANEVARYAGTIGYDLISGVSPRVPRIYKTT